MKSKNVYVEVLRRTQSGEWKYFKKPVHFVSRIDRENVRCPECQEKVKLMTGEKNLFDHYEHYSRQGRTCPFKTEIKNAQPIGL